MRFKSRYFVHQKPLQCFFMPWSLVITINCVSSWKVKHFFFNAPLRPRNLWHSIQTKSVTHGETCLAECCCILLQRPWMTPFDKWRPLQRWWLWLCTGVWQSTHEEKNKRKCEKQNKRSTHVALTAQPNRLIEDKQQTLVEGLFKGTDVWEHFGARDASSHALLATVTLSRHSQSQNTQQQASKWR